MTRAQAMLLALGAAILGALAVFLAMRGGVRDADDEEKGKQVPAAQRVSIENGATVVTLDGAALARSGVAAEPLPPAAQRQETREYATVLDIRDLADARAQLASARAGGEQARARLAAADAEYQRVRTLNADDHNVSDRVVQESEAAVRAERAAAAAADASSAAVVTTVAQRWGTPVANALAAGAPWIDDLLAQRRMLVQVTSPSQPPAKIRLAATDGTVDATFLSPAAHADPHVQGRSWLYRAPAGTLVPGMTVPALTSGHAAVANGAEVPQSAVVWTEGRAWVWVERAKGQFVRTAVDVSTPSSGGYFVTTLAPGTRVVTTGAQQLLSEVAKPQVVD